MPSTEEIAIGAAVISLASFGIASASLWLSHFWKKDPIVVPGSLRLRIYPIKSEDDSWYLSSFDIPISFLNGGSSPILITGIEIKLSYPDIPIPKNHEIFEAKWDVPIDKAVDIDEHRFNWINAIGPTDFMPFVVLPKQTQIKHILFEKRWNDPVVQDSVVAEMFVGVANNKVRNKAGKWSVKLTKGIWDLLAGSGRSLSFGQANTDTEKELTYPDDLHKYTGCKEDFIPKGPNITASSLDYKNE